ncbi:MAG: lysophospholipid acyltransferase family protein [Pelolinea sp.]|nr:lysophospholipid acyltransferase family protein [Pelolinea sp.]
MKKETLQHIVRFLIKTLTLSEYIDVENIPKQGGVILAINHMSQLDTPLLLVNPVRADITGLVTTKYRENLLVSWLTDTAEGIWINRDAADFSAIRKASQALGKGIALGISPEGTRSKNGQLQEGKPGTVMLAVKTGAPIVPVGITGTESAFRELKHFRRPRLTARFGEPFVIPPFEQGSRSQDLKKWTHELMLRIAALLPESYRGFYRAQTRE